MMTKNDDPIRLASEVVQRTGCRMWLERADAPLLEVRPSPTGGLPDVYAWGDYAVRLVPRAPTVPTPPTDPATDSGPDHKI